MSIQSNTWTHPRTGEHRHYINNWAELVGFEIHRYNTGNLSTVFLDDEKISNSLAADTLSAAIWYDDKGEIFIQHRSRRTAISDDTIRERLQPHVDAEIQKTAEIEAAKIAEEEENAALPVGEAVVTEPLNEDSWNGKVNTGTRIVYITVTRTSKMQHIYFYDTKPMVGMYRTNILHDANKNFYKGEELKNRIRTLVEQNF